MTARTPRATGLVARLYLFGAAQVLVMAFVIPWVSHLASGPPSVRPETIAAARYTVDTVMAHHDDPRAFQRELDRVRRDQHAALSLFDAHGALIGTTIDPPLHPGFPAPPPFPPVFARRHGPLHVQVLVPLPPPYAGYALYASTLGPPPLPSALWIVAVALIGCALASVLLARSFAAPLARLAATARAFGAGQLTARTRMHRRNEFGEVAQAFDEMAERVARLIEAQKQLLGNVSHELRTPLARIRVALDLAAEGDTDMARESLREIGEDLLELEQLVNDVLDNARLELHPERGVTLLPLDVTALVERARARFAAAHPQRVLEVTVDGPFDEILGDAALLRRALDNVLDNAAKYSDVEHPVRLSVRVADPRLVFEVIDRGIGIDAADLAHVGTPFFRTDRSRARTTGGIGLGLSLVRRIAEAHGGALTLESTPGHGTTVRIQVPRRAVDAPAG